MSARHFVLSVSATLVLAGCSIGKPVPQTTTYVVESSMPAGNAGTQLPGSLRMGNVRVAAAFLGNSLIYRMDDVNYVSDPNQAFIADPASMLGNEMATWLDRSRAFKSVTQPGSTQSGQAARGGSKDTIRSARLLRNTSECCLRRNNRAARAAGAGVPRYPCPGLWHGTVGDPVAVRFRTRRAQDPGRGSCTVAGSLDQDL